MMKLHYLLTFVCFAAAQNVVLTNDDGWAVALVRAQKAALDGAGFTVGLLTSPAPINSILLYRHIDRPLRAAENQSGTGSSDAPPKPLAQACEFDTCPVGSPAQGSNASDPTLNYVNSFPVTSVKHGIQTVAPKIFHGNAPDLVVSGPNVGNNLGGTVQISGTVGAASEAAREGIPAVAFSAATGSQVSYTTLKAGDTSHLYAAASLTLLRALTQAGKPYLPPGTALNVNYPAAAQCTTGFRFVLTRILANAGAADVQTCGAAHLPTESAVLGGTRTCQSTVSVFNASSKADVGADVQAAVLQRLQSILSCA